MSPDSIEYELVNFESREIWKCLGKCGRFRHRAARPGILPAVCCSQPARLFDRYEQPTIVNISEPIISTASAGQ
jgi:hypothetical protein